MKRVLAGLTAAGVALLAAGCASSSVGAASQPAGKVMLRLGFLENITHATALVGIKEGFFTKNLGKNVTLKLYPFSTGTEEATALLAGQLDAAYVGPNPAIKAWQQSNGSLDQGHLRRRLRRRRAGGQEGHHHGRPSSRARSWRPRRSATPRTWRCATG